jgi:hypothetical protein
MMKKHKVSLSTDTGGSEQLMATYQHQNGGVLAQSVLERADAATGSNLTTLHYSVEQLEGSCPRMYLSGIDWDSLQWVLDAAFI